MEKVDTNQKHEIALTISENIKELARDIYGTRALQRMFDVTDDQ